MRVSIIAVLTAAISLVAVLSATAKVKPVSTDGEATIYAKGDFTGRFDVAYEVWFRPPGSNRSWTSVSLLLVGRRGPASVSIGLSGGYPEKGEASAFVTYATTRSNAKYVTISRSVRNPVIEIRGDERNYYAYLNGVREMTWARSAYEIQRPYLQINGEVSASGDSIRAMLAPIRFTAANKALPTPTCAFTTQGIMPRIERSTKNLLISGARQLSAPASFIRLSDGRAVERC